MHAMGRQRSATSPRGPLRAVPRALLFALSLCVLFAPRAAAAAATPPAPGPQCFACRPSGWGSGVDDPLNVEHLPCCSSLLARPPPAPPAPPVPAHAPPPLLDGASHPGGGDGGVSAGVLGGALGGAVGGAALLGLAGGLVAWRAHRRRRGPSVPFLLPPSAAVPLAQLRRVASRISQSRVGPAPQPRSSYSRLATPESPLGPDGAGGDGAGLLGDDDLETGPAPPFGGDSGSSDGSAPRTRRNSLMRTVSSGLQRSASLLTRAGAGGSGGITRSASILSESALLTASDDGAEEEERDGSSQGAGNDTRRMSLWSLAGVDGVESPPVAGLEDEETGGAPPHRHRSADEL